METNCETIANDRLGLFFSGFNGRYYVAKEFLQADYPEDQRFLESMVSEINGPVLLSSHECLPDS